MNIQKKPLLSIGMIFKNEIRCLERCMKSLQPLRDAIPCELVMADTGSDDGSREIAAQYADILFDFPWINDFAAARNAVMDRCSGKWYFSIDADEWLDSDIAQLVNFLRQSDKQPPFWSVMIRNYTTENLNGEYNDFLGLRLTRMSLGVRYTGEIHEHWDLVGKGVLALGRTILHHDGYIGLSTEKGKAKRDRNMKLLRKKLEKDPEDLLTLMQCVDSCSGTREYEAFLRRAVAGVENRFPLWETIGPPIMRCAVLFAQNQDLPEKDEWLDMARGLFPDSPFTKIDIAYNTFFCLVKEEKYTEAIQTAGEYLKTLEEYRKGNFNAAALMSSTLHTSAPVKEYSLRLQLSNVYLNEKRYREDQELLDKIDISQLTVETIGAYLGNLMNLHAQSGMDMSRKVAELWEHIHTGETDPALQKAAITTAAQGFQRWHREAELEKGYYPSYTAFLSLGEKYEIGLAAAILETVDPGVMAEKLAKVENWGKFPIQALARALEYGVLFPLPGKPLQIEEMDKLAARLASDKEVFLPLAVRIAERTPGETAQQLAWKRGVIVAAVRTFGWSKEDVDAEMGLSIAQAFAHIEKAFLPLCYALDVYREEKLFLLPSMHRFGWFCAQAFEALEAGDLPGFLRCLRQGLSVCEAVQPMVEFLTEHTPQLQKPKPSGELLELAEKVRAMLSAYAPDDPAVVMIKQSAAYQKVAQLIEGPEAGVYGGLKQ